MFGECASKANTEYFLDFHFQHIYLNQFSASGVCISCFFFPNKFGFSVLGKFSYIALNVGIFG